MNNNIPNIFLLLIIVIIFLITHDNGAFDYLLRGVSFNREAMKFELFFIFVVIIIFFIPFMYRNTRNYYENKGKKVKK